MGEKLVNYWWLWVTVLGVGGLTIFILEWVRSK
ncbi:hypothetical protein ACUXCC_002019 [Cytobacillus horneckiae]